jgi:hypothetical protein
MYSKIYSEVFLEPSSYCDKLLYRYTSIRRDNYAFTDPEKTREYSWVPHALPRHRGDFNIVGHQPGADTSRRKWNTWVVVKKYVIVMWQAHPQNQE